MQLPKKLIIDGDILAYQIASVCHRKVEKTNEDGCVEVELVQTAKASQIKEMLNCKLHIIQLMAMTSDVEMYLSGKNNFRYELASVVPYKGNRKAGLKPPALPDVRDLLVKHHGAVVVDGMEADDQISIRATELNADVLIASCDKDFLQIPGYHGFWGDSRGGRVKPWIQVSPERALEHLFMQTLTGDTADNIPGLYGYSNRKALQFLDLLRGSDWSTYMDAVVELYAEKDCKLSGVSKAVKEGTMYYDYDPATGKLNYLSHQDQPYSITVEELVLEIHKLVYLRRTNQESDDFGLDILRGI